MLVCAILCTISAVGRINEPIFAQMVVSIGSTYGVFVISSLLALEPWYVITPLMRTCP
jgi:chitin synthase